MPKHSKRDDLKQSEPDEFNPYDVLGLKETCSDEEIKRAYRVLALKWHPDRASNGGSAEATKKFQELARAHGILSDPARRKLFDQTGEVDGLAVSMEGEEWLNYWRALYPKITIQDIREFEKKYKGSDEELNDLKEAYTRHSGDMDLIMEEVILAEPEDEDRFRDLLNTAIEKGEVKKFKRFTNEPATKRAKRRKVAAQEAEEAEEMAKELGIAGRTDDELRDMILARSRSNFENMMSNLEAKYASKKPAKGKKK